MNRRQILEGSITLTLARLAWPVLVVLTVQTLVGLAETYFVSSLGTAAVAGVALVFPLFMLMTMMSKGGIGGGVFAAIARAVGGGRRRDADALLLHPVVLALVFGALFSAGAWIGQIGMGMDPESLGAAFYIPTVVVPLLFVLHGLIFWQLLRSQD